jgi:hypothetical protein
MKMTLCGVVAELSICGYSLFIRSSPASVGLVVVTPKPRLNSKFFKQIMKIDKTTLVNCNVAIYTVYYNIKINFSSNSVSLFYISFYNDKLQKKHCLEFYMKKKEFLFGVLGKTIKHLSIQYFVMP